MKNNLESRVNPENHNLLQATNWHSWLFNVIKFIKDASIKQIFRSIFPNSYAEKQCKKIQLLHREKRSFDMEIFQTMYIIHVSMTCTRWQIIATFSDDWFYRFCCVLVMSLILIKTRSRINKHMNKWVHKKWQNALLNILFIGIIICIIIYYYQVCQGKKTIPFNSVHQ